MTGAVLVWTAYYLHWSETEDPGLKLAVFWTGPAIRNYAWNLVTEIVGTCVLVFGVLAMGTDSPHVGQRTRHPAGGLPGRRHRHVPRWTDGIRDQPGA